MVERILGIDLGISSLGWAVVEYDKQDDKNNKIIDCGVRLFTAAETPKEKESPNKARRDARGIRRVIKRRSTRMNEIKNLLISHSLLSKNDLDTENGMFNSAKNRVDVWQLRYDALKRVLDNNELSRVLIHIAKHRGFKFIGDEASDEESGKVKKAGAELRNKFQNAGYKTVGEWLWSERGLNQKKRNKSGDYEISIPRDFLVQEIDTIFETQKTFGSIIATEELKKSYKDIAFFVRPMQGIEHMVGNCTYFVNEKRAPKCSISAERFVAIGKFFNTVVIDNFGKEQKIVELKDIDELMDFAVTKEKLEYKHLRKLLELNENQIFKGLTYKSKPKKSKNNNENSVEEWEFDKTEAEKKQWISLKGHAKLKDVFADSFDTFISDIDKADEVVKILTYHKDQVQKKDKLSKIIDNELVEKLSFVSFQDFNNLSIKAIRTIYGLMRENTIRYDEALRYALENGLLPKPANEKSELLPPLKDTDIAILNPTVIRAFAEFRKVANAFVRKYGAFDKVHFELAREVNTKDQIKRIKDSQYKNEKERKAVAQWLDENFSGQNIVPNKKNILKKRLYDDQDGRCAYTGEPIKLERLFDDGYCEIDHILPRSRSADDSYANKALCLASANQNKTNQTPFEWLGKDKQVWQKFKQRIDTSINRAKLGNTKVARLLKENFDENFQKEFLSRNLNDTRYMAKAIKAYCENYWKLAHDDDKLRVQVRSGKLTSELRGRWIEGFMKDRSLHYHHAIDAIVVAFSTQSMVQKLSNFYNQKELKRSKEKLVFNPPMENFRNAVESSIVLDKKEILENGNEVSRLLISRPPRASVTGAAHKETIQSPSDYKGRGVSINNGKGICDNGDMPRVDVFTKDGKYYLVPIYVADFAKEELPNRAIVAGKDKEWVEMDKSYEFLFSLHKEDLVQIQLKNEEPFMGYFKGAHSATAQVQIQSIDSDFVKIAGSKTAVIFKKYIIDPLGYYHEVKNEKRLGTIPQEALKNGVNERRKKKRSSKKAKIPQAI